MLETSARLLRLLALLQSRPQWPGSELAARLEVTPRTLRRDIQRLRDLDYPVHSLPGVAGGYQLGSGAALPPLQLDDDEAVAVVLSLRSSASHMLTGLAEASLSALTKLDQVLPARLNQRLSALRHATVALDGPEPVIDPALLTLLAAACRAHQRVRLNYTDRGGAATQRQIEPYRLVSGGYRWYLMAFDTDRADWRTFRVDRISEPELAGGRFVPREAPDPASFVGTAVTVAPYQYQAEVLVHAPASALAGRISPTSGMLTPVGEDRSLLRIGANSLDAMAFHLLALGTEFTVIKPPELVGHLRHLAGRLLRAASPDGQAPDQNRGEPPPP
ncbi:MAG TPA: YafY family protein [Streptosporangiaceae bacterium]|nr:YafY family protein [Streptosporangiaceae bacterium]